MTPPSAPPASNTTKRLRLLKRMITGALIAVAVLLITAWVVLNFWVVPRTDHYREDIERLASTHLGAPVLIEQISAQRQGLWPVVTLHGVRVLNPTGQAALSLNEIAVVPSFKAFLLFDLQFSKIILKNPVLDIERQSNGQISIAGINISAMLDTPPSGQSETGTALLPESVLWLLEQPELVIQNGQVRWTDHLLDVPVFNLTETDISIRRQGRNHHIQIEATPPTSWGTRFLLQGNFIQPHASSAQQLQHWEGAAYARFPEANIEQLQNYIALPIELTQGHGAVEIWAQYNQEGQLAETRAKLNLTEVELQTAPELPVLHLQDFKGTVTGSWQQGTYRLQTDDLTFRTASQTQPDHSAVDTQVWNPSHLDISWQFDTEGNLDGGIIKTGQVNLGLLAQLARRLPLPQKVQTLLSSANPQGEVEYLNAQWQQHAAHAMTYNVSGQINRLDLAPGTARPQPPDTHQMDIARPGVSRLSAEFAFNEKDGQAQLRINDGSVSLPGLFEQPDIQVQQAFAEIHWEQQANGEMHVSAPVFDLLNDSAKVHAQIDWKRPSAEHPDDQAGYLQLTGTLEQGNATHVYRYLPLSIPQEIRDYLKSALIAGTASDGHFHIEGPLKDFPFHLPGTGTFLIEGQGHDVTFDYAPEVIRSAGQGPWPVLSHVNGQLRFTSQGMLLQNVTGQVRDAPDIQLSAQEASIEDWNHNDTHVRVSGTVSGPLSEQLRAINQSAIGHLLDGVLASATASGKTDTQLKLDISIEKVHESTVSGQITFADNTLSLWPFMPQLQQVKGQLNFTGKGFFIDQIQAQTLGGALHGKAQWTIDKGLSIQASGRLTAQGLLNDPNWRHQLPFVQQWLAGSTGFTIQARTENQQQILQIQSDLVGMQLKLPSPLDKAEQDAYPLLITLTPLAQNGTFWPLSIELLTRPATQQLPTIHANYVLDSGTNGITVTQGSIGINQEPVMPIAGTTAQIQLQQLDISGWQAFLAELSKQPAATTGTSRSTTLTLPSWWPQSVKAQIDQIIISPNLTLHQAEIQMQRQNRDWGAKINTREAAGQLDWQAATSDTALGLLRVRLSRLKLPELDLESTAGSDETTAASPDHIFTLLPDVQMDIDHLSIGALDLGKLAFTAHTDRTVVPPRWQIDQLNLTTGASTLQAKGYWANTPAPTTSLELALNTPDAGQLLTQLDLSHSIANAPGTLKGELSWHAAPYHFDLNTLHGQLTLQLGKGQLLVANPRASRLLSVLSLQSLPNRLSLDFRDVFKDGLAFNALDGHFLIDNGLMQIHTLQLNGVNALVHATGKIDLRNQTQQLQVTVAPEINAGAASLALTAVNPAVGIGSLAAQLVLREPLRRMATKVYYISGSWEEPDVTDQSPEPANPAPAVPDLAPDNRK